MKTVFLLLSFFSLFIISCTKNSAKPDGNPVIADNHQLKNIIFPIDSTIPLCENCPPVITLQSQNFKYDDLGRLVSRMVINNTLSETPEPQMDTFYTYTYFYEGNSSVISSYTETARGLIINHLLAYNSADQIILDSVTNPQISNNKVSRFEYAQGYIIVTEKQVYPIGTQIITDTMIVENNNVLNEKIKKVLVQSVSYIDMSYTFGNFQNPLGYLNNISLLGSDYKNGVSSIFYNAENFSAFLPSEKNTKYWGANGSLTEYGYEYTASLDSLGRVISLKNITDRNRAVVYEYY